MKSVKINLDRDRIKGNKETEFDYDEISGNLISALVILEFRNVQITAKVEWVEELKYPLMFIEKISNIG